MQILSLEALDRIPMVLAEIFTFSLVSGPATCHNTRYKQNKQAAAARQCEKRIPERGSLKVEGKRKRAIIFEHKFSAAIASNPSEPSLPLW